MRVLLNILICLIAWPVLAFGPYALTHGWADGNAEMASAFYPPLNASPRYTDGTNWWFAKDVWAQDFANAVNERRAYVGLGVISNEWEGVRVPWEHERLHELKQDLKAAVPGYINLETRNGNYNEWFEQWNYGASPYNATNHPLYLSHVFHPPNWSFSTTTNSPGVANPVTYVNSGTAFYEWAELPTNFFEYTPARFLGATTVFYTNEYTSAGGPLPEGRTNEWNTLDYGWGGMTRALNALQDVRRQENLYLSEVDDFYNTNIDECDTFRGIGEEHFSSSWLVGIYAEYGCLDFTADGGTYYELGLINSTMGSWGMAFEYYSAPDGSTNSSEIVPLIFEMFEAQGQGASHRHALENDSLVAFQIEMREPEFSVYHAVVYQAAGGSLYLSNPDCPSTNYLASAWQLYSSVWEFDDESNLVLMGGWMPVVPPDSCCATFHSGGFPGVPIDTVFVDPAASCIQEANVALGMGSDLNDGMIDLIATANSDAQWHAFHISAWASRGYSRFNVFRPDFVYQ